MNIDYDPVDPDNPAVIAAADQDLARMNDRLDALITTWRIGQDRLAAECPDHTKRLAVFMAGVVTPHHDVTAVLAMLTIAIDRLAASHEDRA